jgi:hypothetical protein
MSRPSKPSTAAVKGAAFCGIEPFYWPVSWYYCLSLGPPRPARLAKCIPELPVHLVPRFSRQQQQKAPRSFHVPCHTIVRLATCDVADAWHDELEATQNTNAMVNQVTYWTLSCRQGSNMVRATIRKSDLYGVADVPCLRSTPWRGSTHDDSNNDVHVDRRPHEPRTCQGPGLAALALLRSELLSRK